MVIEFFSACGDDPSGPHTWKQWIKHPCGWQHCTTVMSRTFACCAVSIQFGRWVNIEQHSSGSSGSEKWICEGIGHGPSFHRHRNVILAQAKVTVQFAQAFRFSRGKHGQMQVNSLFSEFNFSYRNRSCIANDRSNYSEATVSVTRIISNWTVQPKKRHSREFLAPNSAHQGHRYQWFLIKMASIFPNIRLTCKQLGSWTSSLHVAVCTKTLLYLTISYNHSESCFNSTDTTEPDTGHQEPFWNKFLLIKQSDKFRDTHREGVVKQPDLYSSHQNVTFATRRHARNLCEQRNNFPKSLVENTLHQAARSKFSWATKCRLGNVSACVFRFTHSFTIA